jgi:hypothetical protein
MTEAKWLACKAPERMLDLLSDKVSDRKLRLLACACAAISWQRLPEASQEALLVAGDFADGRASRGQLVAARETAAVAAAGTDEGPRRDVLACTYAGRADEVIRAVLRSARKEPIRKIWCHLIRDVFGNPFRSGALDLASLTPTVSAMARVIYDERQFDSMPILADALQDAGCTAPGILKHCRQPGDHVRGCWVVDLILGKQ